MSLVAVFILSFGLGAGLVPQFQSIESAHHQPNNLLILLLGDSSRMFANQFFVEADAYYHSGFYPTIFDNNAPFKTAHMAEDTGAVASHNSGNENGFMGPPRDWLDAFGRHFIPNRHTHLSDGGPTGDLHKSTQVREILPWLKLSSKLDPENIRTYLVMSFWLRTTLNTPSEAEVVVREGLRNNPGDPQLLFELGRINFDNYHDPVQARNIWQAAVRSWYAEEPGVPISERLKYKDNNANFDDRFVFEQIEMHLAQLEGSLGNRAAAIGYLQKAELAAPDPSGIQKQIDELKSGKMMSDQEASDKE